MKKSVEFTTVPPIEVSTSVILAQSDIAVLAKDISIDLRVEASSLIVI